MKITILLFATVLLMLAAPSMAQDGRVWLDNVEGLSNGSILIGSGSVTFNLGLANEAPQAIGGVANGFRIYGSDSSVTWEVWDYGPWGGISDCLPDWFLFAPPEFHGVGADTIGFTGYRMFSNGIPVGYDGPFFWIAVTLADSASIGGTFCLDSSWFPPDGNWRWAYGAYHSFPSWDGPHCWPVVGSCCIGIRGNINGDPGDQVDISDLVYLVDFMFSGGSEPPCMEEADIDGSGEVDISDLVWFVDFMFNFGFPPADCP